MSKEQYCFKGSATWIRLKNTALCDIADFNVQTSFFLPRSSSPITVPGLPKEEEEPIQSGSVKYRKDMFRRRSEWAKNRPTLNGKFPVYLNGQFFNGILIQLHQRRVFFLNYHTYWIHIWGFGISCLNKLKWA